MPSPGLLRARPSYPADNSVFPEIDTRNPQPRIEDAGPSLAETAARAHADTILSDAHERARRIVDAARNEAETIREVARQSGEVQARAEAEIAARAEYDAALLNAVEAARTDFAVLAEQLRAEQTRLWAAAETELRDLALAIAEKVIKAEVTVNPDVVTHLTQHALRRLAGTEHVRVRVNPDDVPRLRERRDDLLATLEGLKSVEILDDRRVGIGGVQIETDAGTIDSRLETQLAEIARALD